jgi:hypothetical protein
MITWWSLEGQTFAFTLFLWRFFHLFESTALSSPSDSTVSVDAGVTSRTVATLALAVRRSNHSAISQLYSLPLAQKWAFSLPNANV